MKQPSPLTDIATGLRGLVQRWEVIDPNGSIAQAGGGHQNLILDQGMDMPATMLFRDLSKYCAIGTDNADPNTAQVGLGAEVARTGNTSTQDTYWDSSAKTVTHHRDFLFAVGALDGTFYEVGFSPNSGAGDNLFARTLFKDASGNPTSVTVAPDQQLRVTYDLILSPKPNTQTAGSVDITNVGTVNYTHMMQQVQGTGYGDEGRRGYADVNSESRIHNGFALEPAVAGNFELGTDVYTFQPYGDQEFYYFEDILVGSTKRAYANGDHYVDKDIVLDPADYQNLDIVTIVMKIDDDFTDPYTYYALVVDSADRFTKADTHRLTLTFRFSWARN